jgi:hypothetical protein
VALFLGGLFVGGKGCTIFTPNISSAYPQQFLRISPNISSAYAQASQHTSSLSVSSPTVATVTVKVRPLTAIPRFS